MSWDLLEEKGIGRLKSEKAGYTQSKRGRVREGDPHVMLIREVKEKGAAIFSEW